MQSIPTAELPDGWSWPPRYVVSYSDALERRFTIQPDGRIHLVLDPAESDDDRKLRMGEV